MTLENQLQQILGIKQDIKSVLNDKGIETGDDFSSYVAKIEQIQGGSAIGGAFNLFDTKLADHILEGDEAKGWALQGTSVSKKDYPSFYERCLEEYKQSVFNGNFITVNGDLTQTGAVLSGFDLDKYAGLPYNFKPGTHNWEIVFKIQTGEDVQTEQYLFSFQKGNTNETRYATRLLIGESKFKFSVTYNGTAWDIVTTTTSDCIGKYSVQPNTTYYVKFEFTGEAYKLSYSSDGVDFTQDCYVASTTPMYNDCQYCVIGLWNNGATLSPWLGSIDLSGCYININGKRWWDNIALNKHANGHMFYPISNKSVIDTLFNTTGSAWMYGIDEEDESILLPRNIWFEQPTGDVSEVTSIVEAGLPNITGFIQGQGNRTAFQIAQGAFSKNGNISGAGMAQKYDDSCDLGVYFDASKSNPIYGNSDTVQPNAIKKLLYICVGNTIKDEATIDLTKEIELNSPFFLGQSQYFEVEPNNLSWLKSTGEFHSKDLYPSMFEYIKENIEKGTKDFKRVNEAYDDYSYILDEENETFRLPLLNGSESITSEQFTLVDLPSSGTNIVAPYNGLYSIAIYGNNDEYVMLSKMNENQSCIRHMGWTHVTKGLCCASLEVKAGDTVMVQYTASQGLYYFKFIKYIGNGSLYYFVGEAVNNANLVDLGKMSIELSNKLAMDLSNMPSESKSYLTGLGMPSDKYIDLTLGASGSSYTAPANGWFTLRKKASANGQFVYLDGIMSMSIPYGLNGGGSHVYSPVKKGDKITIIYNLGGDTAHFKFHYAEGEQ